MARSIDGARNSAHFDSWVKIFSPCGFRVPQRNVVLEVALVHELEQKFQAWILGGHEKCFPTMCLTSIGNDLKGVYSYRLGH